MQIQSSIEIDRPADEVFDFVSNFENNPRWQSGMRHAQFTSEPPLRVGSTYEQRATFLGRAIVTTFEVTDLKPGRSVSIASIESTFPIQVVREVLPLSEGRCRVTAHVAGQTEGWFRLLGPVMRFMVKRSVDGDYATLKRMLEGSD
ncbi:MAG: SRPBCC family protein [Myxococcales bacterium]|nr:SRPBCC family protein [Myxococcales bacterium]